MSEEEREKAVENICAASKLKDCLIKKGGVSEGDKKRENILLK